MKNLIKTWLSGIIMPPNWRAPLTDKPRQNASAAYDWLMAELDTLLPAPEIAAMFNRGVAYMKGQGVSKDQTLAAHWFKEAAKQGYDEAQFFIGVMYAAGEGVTQNYVESMQWHLKAAAQGHTGSQCSLGVLYTNGIGVSKDDEEAVKWFRRAATADNAEGQYNLGAKYANGEGVAQNNVQGHKWLNLAATRVKASDTELREMAIEGRAQLEGRMTPAQIAEAQKLASEWEPWNDAEGQYNLGLKFANGQGVSQDYTKAVQWYQRAAEQDHVAAQFHLGVLYEEGRCVARDYIQAMQWFQKVADKGFPVAQYNLGVMYAKGQGVPQDYVQAVFRWQKAANQGNAAAQFALGVAYSNGEGVSHDYVQAYKWFYLTAACSTASDTELHDIAIKERDEVSAKMTPAQIDEAEKLARKWRPE